MTVLVLRASGEVKRVDVSAPSYFEAVLAPLRWDDDADPSAPVHYERVEYRDSKHVTSNMTPVWTVDGEPPQNAPWPVFRYIGRSRVRVALSRSALLWGRMSATDLAWEAARMKLKSHAGPHSLVLPLGIDPDGTDEAQNIDWFIVYAAGYQPIQAVTS